MPFTYNEHPSGQAKRWRRVKIQKKALIKIIERKKKERLKVSEWIVKVVMDSWENCWMTMTTETVVESVNMSWSVAVNHEVSKGEWEKSGSIEAKKHRICWSLSVNILSVQEVRQQEREQHIQELQDWLIDSLEDDMDMSVAAKNFERGEEDYEHMLMDLLLQELSLGIVNMEVGECTRRMFTPPTASLLFSPGEETAGHLNLDNMLEPRKQDCQTQSAIMDWDDDGDRSLMEWQEEEEPDRIRKRKRKSNHRSRK